MPVTSPNEELRVVGMESAGTWTGEPRPWGLPKILLGMWLFVVSDSLTFAALFVTYGLVRIASSEWPHPFEVWPSIGLALLMTACLVGSAFTMAAAVRGARDRDPRRSARAIAATVTLGLAFLCLHLAEWWRLGNLGVSLRHNPWGAPLFGATFYALTGLHLLHVAAGIVALSIVAHRVRRDTIGADAVAAAGLYWQFVDAVWLLIFSLLYATSTGSGAGA